MLEYILNICDSLKSKDLGKVKLHKYREDCDSLELDQNLATKGVSIIVLLYLGEFFAKVKIIEFGELYQNIWGQKVHQ